MIVTATSRWRYRAHVLHEASFKEEPEQKAEGVCPPEGARYRQSPVPEGLQFFLLALVGQDANSSRTLAQDNKTIKPH